MEASRRSTTVSDVPAWVRSVRSQVTPPTRDVERQRRRAEQIVGRYAALDAARRLTAPPAVPSVERTRSGFDALAFEFDREHPFRGTVTRAGVPEPAWEAFASGCVDDALRDSDHPRAVYLDHEVSEMPLGFAFLCRSALGLIARVRLIPDERCGPILDAVDDGRLRAVSLGYDSLLYEYRPYQQTRALWRLAIRPNELSLVRRGAIPGAEIMSERELNRTNSEAVMRRLAAREAADRESVRVERERKRQEVAAICAKYARRAPFVGR